LVSGGLKVSLERVEEFASQIPGVQEVIAVALDSKFGQSVGLVYAGSPEAEFSSLVELSLAAKPLKVLRVPELPRLDSGKPDLRAAAKLLDS
jgi:o-succinylbenzoate---CoA ligase